MRKATPTRQRRSPSKKERPASTSAGEESFDRTLLCMMEELSVEQRLEWLCSTLRGIEELRHGLRT
jgi:hypothetical protein